MEHRNDECPGNSPHDHATKAGATTADSAFGGRKIDYNATMTRSGESGVESGAKHRGGCLRALVAAPVLAVLAPVSALYRSRARWRRGTAVVVSTHTENFERIEGDWAKVVATVDIPHIVDGGRLITRSVVRIAEFLDCAGHVFHLVHREPGCEETIAVPVGAAINDLAERLALSCGRSILDGKTLVWLALPRGRHLGETLDPIAYDPDAPGEPDGVLHIAPMIWALALKRRRGVASTVFEMCCVVPAQLADRVEQVVIRLRG